MSNELRIITVGELKEILAKHAAWSENKKAGKRADLRYADLRSANLILVGQDVRGYLFWAFVGDSGAVELRAGCRWLKGVASMRAHWVERHSEDPILREDCLSLVDRCERMAKARG